MAMQHREIGARGYRRRKEIQEMQRELVALGGAWLLVDDWTLARRLAGQASCRFQVLDVGGLTFCRYAPEREARMLELQRAWTHEGGGTKAMIAYSTFISTTEKGTLNNG